MRPASAAFTDEALSDRASCIQVVTVSACSKSKCETH